MDFQILLLCRTLGAVEQNGCLVAPRSGVQFLKLRAFPLKPRISWTGLVLLELSYRAKGTIEMSVRGFTFPFVFAATPYSPRFRDNCP